jgi:hypothetical protein
MVSFETLQRKYLLLRRDVKLISDWQQNCFIFSIFLEEREGGGEGLFPGGKLNQNIRWTTCGEI